LLALSADSAWFETRLSSPRDSAAVPSYCQ
jgi:hypothetical protein